MKIVYCMPSLHNSGGIERVVTQKANSLAEDFGHEILIVTTDMKGRAPYYALSAKVRHIDLGINYDDTDNISLLQRWRERKNLREIHKAKLNALLLQERADVAVSVFSHELSVLPQLQDGRRKVLELHFSRYYRRLEDEANGACMIKRWLSRIMEWENRKWIKKYDRFVVLSEEDKDAWKRDTECEAIPNFVGEQFVKEPLSHTGGNRKVVAAGRLCPQKGFDILLNSWKNIRYDRRSEGWTLEIYGAGPDEEILNDRIATLGINDTVKICGPVKDIKQKMQEADIFCFPSRYEGQGMSLTEAMALGVPSVAFACPCGPRELIGKERGILIENIDADSLATGLLKMMCDEALRKKVGAKGSEYVRENYSKEKIMAKWNKLFKSLDKR